MRAERDYPANGGIENLKGVIAIQQGHPHEAEKDFLAAVRHSPRLAGAYLNLGRLYRENVAHDPNAEAKALRAYEKALEAFAAAFTKDVVLEASVLPRLITGAADVRSFFEATRAMYDTIAFKHEGTVESRTYLEWEGTFQGHSVAGMTVFTKDTAGLIESIRLYHRPYDMVIAFSTDLAGRLAGKMTVDPFFGSASGGIP